MNTSENLSEFDSQVDSVANNEGNVESNITKEKPKIILLNPQMLPELEKSMQESSNFDLSSNPLGEVTLDDLDNPFAATPVEEKVKEEVPMEKPVEEAVDVISKPVEEPVEESEHPTEIEIKEEAKTITEEIPLTEISMEALCKKRDELLEKQKKINQIHKEIIDLEKPAIRDVNALRKKIDGCFAEIHSLKVSKQKMNAAIEKAQSVQEKLEEKREALNEKKKVVIFEFETKHLVKLKEIEESIRSLV